MFTMSMESSLRTPIRFTVNIHTPNPELLVIGRLSTFQAPEVDVYEDLHPMRILLAVLEAEQVSPLIKGGGKQTISLRAPPALAA